MVLYDWCMGDEAQTEGANPFMETGRITIVTGVTPDGSIRRSFSIEGLNPYESLGTLQAVSDLIRVKEAQTWLAGAGDD